MARSRLAAALAATIAVLLLTSFVRVSGAFSDTSVRGADFTAMYIAGRMASSGDGSRLYDRQAQIEQHRALGTPAHQLDNPFVNPPVAAALVAPLTRLDLVTAYRVWTWLQLALIALAAAVAAAAAPWPRRLPRAIPVAVAALATAGAGTGMTFFMGQWDGIPALGLAVAYACLRRGRSGPGGLALGSSMALAKPHLALGLAAWMLGRRDRRLLAGGGLGVATTAAASLLAVGPAATAAFLRAPGLSSAVSPLPMLLGLNGLAGSWAGDGRLAWALAAPAMAAALVAAGWLGHASRRGRHPLEVSLAGAVALSLLASPHLLGQDIVLAAIAWVWCMGRASAADGPAHSWPGPRSAMLLAGWAALDLCVRTDVGRFTSGAPGRLVPWVLTTAGLAALGLCEVIPGPQVWGTQRTARGEGRGRRMSPGPPAGAPRPASASSSSAPATK